MSKFLGPLDVREEDEFGGLFQLLAPLAYQSDMLRDTITVPAGFHTDFASVPRLPIIYLTEGGKGNKAAVVHDWLYSSGNVDRKTADEVLREALIASGYSRFTANLFYAAVRVGGTSFWHAPKMPQPTQVRRMMRNRVPAA